MNKSRRMAAMQARAFATQGFGVLQIDLFGCGDSSGEFRDARWEIWKHDLEAAKNWLENRVRTPIGLWGLRLGALLALNFARDVDCALDRIILWQPVISGQSFLTQFLRLRLANEMLTVSASTPELSGTNAMRALLRKGNNLEVAGYELSHELASAIDDLNATELTIMGVPIHWFEIATSGSDSMNPVGAKVVAAWKREGVNLDTRVVACPPFWATQEISECPDLVSSTTAVLGEAAS
ncbi:exosortase A-associated hydrolase 2 [Nitrosospira multiformis]|uniref:Exosortase A-associated hydrolase 2 n=2 Tax=Nitrosospira multiformis TaxID=1231 RepID=A0A2T5I5P8_9PROT|nr:exosortase A-associated hydrolase 2 [Nitrosospira multiformis]